MTIEAQLTAINDTLKAIQELLQNDNKAPDVEPRPTTTPSKPETESSKSTEDKGVTVKQVPKAPAEVPPVPAAKPPAPPATSLTIEELNEWLVNYVQDHLGGDASTVFSVMKNDYQVSSLKDLDESVRSEFVAKVKAL